MNDKIEALKVELREINGGTKAMRDEARGRRRRLASWVAVLLWSLVVLGCLLVRVRGGGPWAGQAVAATVLVLLAMAGTIVQGRVKLEPPRADSGFAPGPGTDKVRNGD